MEDINSTNAVLEAVFDTFRREKTSGGEEGYTPRINGNNPVLNLMHYFLVYKHMELIDKNNDRRRLKYDGDSRAFRLREYGDREVWREPEKSGKDEDRLLHADVTVSFWTPFKELVNREYTNSVRVKSGEELEFIISVLEPGPDPLPSDGKEYKTENARKAAAVRKVAQFAEVRQLAELYLTRGNLWILPKRKMNNKRYQLCSDIVGRTLKECFPGGRLNCFFTDITPEKWMKGENLASCFKGGIIRRDNLGILQPGNDNLFGESGEIRDYLRKVCELIKIRNEDFKKDAR